MLCAIHANQSIAKKMKADPDEMTENLMKIIQKTKEIKNFDGKLIE